MFTKKKKTGKVTIPKELVGEDDEVSALLQSSFAPCPPKKGNVLPAKEAVPQPPTAKPNLVPCPPKKGNSLGQVARPLPFIKSKMPSAAKKTAESTKLTTKVNKKYEYINYLLVRLRSAPSFKK